MYIIYSHIHIYIYISYKTKYINDIFLRTDQYDLWEMFKEKDVILTLSR